MIFRGCRGFFEYDLWQKIKTRKRRKSTVTNLVRKRYFDLANGENCLKIQFSVCIDNAGNQQIALQTV